jgi:hypothetical protein
MSDDEELDIHGATATFVADVGYDEDEAIDDLDLGDDDQHARVSRLEAAVQKLSAQHEERERKRVRRKVKAATGGASLAGLIPIGLQLLDALHVTATVASTVAAAAGAAGALLAGYLTPEREGTTP